jgi:peroxiredoxin
VRAYRFVATGIVMAVLALSLVAVVIDRRPAAPERRPNVLGAQLPNVDVQTTSGTHVKLRDRVGGQPTLLFVTNAAQCASCSNLPLEFEVVRRELPAVRPLLVASGSSIDAFRPLLDRMHLSSDAVVDDHRSLLAALRVTTEPLTLLTDSSGRIVFVDWRSTSEAAQYPIGTVLHDLSGILRAR